jgi:ABC-type branched-subunit amino acid transport system substrate-binding protein
MPPQSRTRNRYVIGEDYEYGHSIADNFWKGLQKNKPDVEKIGEAWPKLQETDYTPYLTKAMQSGAEVLGGIVYGGDQQKQQGLQSLLKRLENEPLLQASWTQE